MVSSVGDGDRAFRSQRSLSTFGKRQEASDYSCPRALTPRAPSGPEGPVLSSQPRPAPPGEVSKT